MPRNFASTADRLHRASTWLYRQSVRRFMPVHQPVRFAGVIIPRDRRYGDRLFNGRFYRELLLDIPDYEAALVQGLNMHVKPGMTIVVIGTGLGVTAAIAAKLAGPTGRVICYEGSRVNAGLARETARLNGVADLVQVHYGVVGPAIGVYHDDDAAPQVAIGDLPECDVLELDCEGSERQILADLRFHPAHILVETHGMNGAPTDEIARLLQSQGYDTTDLGLAEPRDAAFCAQSDIRVLAASRRILC